MAILPGLLLSFTSIMAQPKITSFTPASGPAGSTVTVSGSGFSADPANDVVYFGAVKGTVTSASETSLQVTVPRGSTYKPLSVLNVATGLSSTATNAFVATYTNTNSSPGISSTFYQPKVDFPVNANFIQPQAVDIDGDGKTDIVSISSLTGSIAILRNISTTGSVGAGSFDAPVNISLSSSPVNLVIRDMDGDGKPDLVVNRSSVITIFLNLSSPGSLSAGSFAAGQNFSVSAGQVAVGDADADGRLDLVISRADQFNAHILVMRNTSVNGSLLSFDTPVEVGRTGNPTVDELAVADLNGDEMPEIFARYASRAVLSIFNNQSTPGSITPSSFNNGSVVNGSGTFLNSFALGDLNGDGKPDLVLSGSASAYITVYIATATSFAAPVIISPASTTFPSTIAINDLDGDSRPDIVLSYSNNNFVTVYRNQSMGTDFNASSLAAGVNFTVAQNAASPLLFDIDQDGVPEITTFANGGSGSTISILKTAMVVLPVAFGTFTAKQIEKEVRLDWNTYSEINNTGFDVQRSADGNAFEKIGFVKGNGTSNTEHLYSFTDNTPVAGKGYYRLKQIDADGNTRFSPVRTVLFSSTGVSLTVYPNPVKGTLVLDGNGKSVQGRLDLFDAYGKLVLQLNLNPASRAMVDVSRLSAGVYSYHLGNFNGIFIKQ